MMKRLFCAALCALVCTLCACGKADAPSTPDSDKTDVRIGIVLPDSGNLGFSHLILSGVQSAAKALGLREPLLAANATDTAFDETAEPKAAPTGEPDVTAAAEPESYTTEDGEVIVRAVPIDPTPQVNAAAAAASLAENGCTVLVFADARYDDISAYIAAKLPQVTVLQYGGTHGDIANLQAFADDPSGAFYLAGAAAGLEGKDTLGFVARKGNPPERMCINAFALGAARTNAKAQVVVRMTGVETDLELERTVPLALIETDKCSLLAQTVFTALPVSVAANTDGTYKHDPIPAIGYGYDMAMDGGSRYLGSVVYDFSVYFENALQSIRDGAFDNTPYIGGMREGLVTFTGLSHASAETTESIELIRKSIREGSFVPLGDFTPEKSGYAANVTIQ